MKPILKLSIILFGIIITFSVITYFLQERLPDFFQKGKQIVHERPNDGYYREHFEDGTLKSEEYYENGKKEGVWKKYHPNGSLKILEAYNNDFLDGLTVHYDSCEKLIFTELFDKGVCRKREVVNDSLYKFQIRIIPHGKSVFENHCQNCHGVEEKLVLAGDSIQNSDLAFMALDSVHTALFDSLFTDSLQINTLYSDTLPLNGYDIDALQFFLQNLSTKPEGKIIRTRTLRVKGKKS